MYTPNLSPVYLRSETPRGGLLDRWLLAEAAKCSYIEVPCHLIYNKTEEELTQLDIGSFIGDKEIPLLYSKNENIPSGLRYIFHTDPSIGKRARDLWHVQKVIVGMDYEVNSLRSEADIMEAAAMRIITIEATDIYVNCPVIDG